MDLQTCPKRQNAVFYAYVLPPIYEQGWVVFLPHFIIGSWLSVHTLFHYTMGWLTNPGVPPKVGFVLIFTTYISKHSQNNTVFLNSLILNPNSITKFINKCISQIWLGASI